MDRLESMSLFVAAVEAGSLSAAARKLAVPLATLSRRVAELEGRLGARLLHRTSRKLGLTDAGAAYLAACRRILADVAEAERTAGGEYSAPRGDLVITAPLAFGRIYVVPVVAEFLRLHAAIDVRLALSDRVASLLEEGVDAAVRIGELPDSNLSAVKLGAVRRVVIASPGYLAERGTPRRPAELHGHDCVTFAGIGSPHAWTFVGGKEDAAVAVRSRLVVDAAEAAIDAAIAGVGLTRVLSYQAAAAEAAGSLVRVLRAFEPPAVPVQLVHAGVSRIPLKLRVFLDFAGPRIKARLRG